MTVEKLYTSEMECSSSIYSYSLLDQTTELANISVDDALNGNEYKVLSKFN